jgi:hypothetical protein
MTTLPRWRTAALGLTLLALAASGCAHNRESFFPPGRKTARAEPPLDPATPGATQKASNDARKAATARRGVTRSRDADESADVFDFDAYRE